MLIYPQKAADLAILKKQQISYLPYKGASRTSAWSLMKTFLELSGFSIIKRKNQYIIVRNASIQGGASNREPLPVYAGVIPDELPQDDTRITYIHYLRNLKVPTLSEKDTHPLSKMIQEFLSNDASLLFDPKANALIITDRASHVVSLARLLEEFDNKGVKEQVAYVPLNYLSAKEVVNIFNSLKIASGSGDTQGRKFIRTDPRADAITYFTQDTRIVADPIRNGIVLMGRQNHVDKITEFIEESLDVPPDKGESILHFYDLQYLDNVKMAPILTRLVSSSLPSGEQATTEGSQKPLFQGVAIAAEESVVREPKLKTQDIIIEQKGFPEIEGLNVVSTNAGNRLIIAARQKDWHTIKNLLKKLDVPQRQVLIEILIVEFSYDQRTKLAGTNRSKTDAPLLPEGLQYLASHVTSVNSVLGSTPQQLAEDLLQVVGPGSVASQTGPGSLLLSINDPKTPGIFGLLQALDNVLAAKISAYPYITIKNNTEGTLDSTETRQTTGDIVTEFDGSFSIPIIDLPASISITAIPHIISDKRLRLNISFVIDEFFGLNQFDRLTRELRTTATLNSGEILAMGGIIRVDNTDNSSYTPILGNIPLFGAFFRNNNIRTVRRNITLFVMPTILETRKMWTERTKNFICENSELAGVAQRSSDLRDPIFRLFFHDTTQRKGLDDFIDEGSNLQDFSLKDCAGPKLLRCKTSKKEQVAFFDPNRLKRMLALKRSPLLYRGKYSVS